MSRRSAWPTSSTSTAPARRSTSAVVDGLVAEHARGRRALLAGVEEGGLHERGHDLVEVGVGVDDHAVLAAHLRDHALEVLLRGGRLGRGAHDLLPDLRRAGERDRVHARVAHQRGADLALARQQRQRVGRHARLAQRAHEHVGAARRLLGGLEHDRVAGREPGGDHPAGDRDREVPRRDHRDDAARAVARACCARPAPAAAPRRPAARPRRARSTRGSRSPRTRRRRPRATAWRTRAPPAPRPRAGARAATRRRARARRRAPRRGGGPSRGGRRGRPRARRRRRPARPRRRARRRGRARPGRSRRARRRCGRPAPTQTGTSSGPRASCSRSASARPARTGARRSSSTGSLAKGERVGHRWVCRLLEPDRGSFVGVVRQAVRAACRYQRRRCAVPRPHG